MAELNLEFYSGKDEYSDGNVEDFILELVTADKNMQDIKNVSDREDKYALLYHLSSLRENILNWYPFSDECTVLEIGSGCGALTGLLCEKAGSVTSIELSMKRSQINFERNKKFCNLEIIVGNFNEIVLERKYDYIIINGVLEYAAIFSNTEDPYSDFLHKVSHYLNERGKILLAIENRLGIKYFSGSMEDHTNRYFLGLNNYDSELNVRTFSRDELYTLFIENDFNKIKFYYPYPDYKFPVEIFTDYNINDGRYGRRVFNFERNKINLFDEYKVIRALMRESTMQHFANSFFVEASKGSIPVEIEYAKLNNTRKKALRISTVVENHRKGKVVIKKALNSEAVAHIEKIYNNTSKILNNGYDNLKGTLYSDYIEYPFINDININKQIQNWLYENNTIQITNTIHKIYDSFFSKSLDMEEYYTDDFRQVFGETVLEGEIECVKDANIDIICDNLYNRDGKILVTDCEWVFDFWIPKQFIIWRTINELFVQLPIISNVIELKQFYLEFGIDDNKDYVFREWANYFAQNYVSDAQLEEYHNKMVSISLNDYIKETQIYTNLYINIGNGYSEDIKITKVLDMACNQFHIVFDLSDYQNIISLRWDPWEGNFCTCKINSCMLDNIPVSVSRTNADNDNIFLTDDPQIEFKISSDLKPDKLIIAGEINLIKNSFVSEYFADKMDKQSKRNEDLQKEILANRLDSEERHKKMVEQLNGVKINNEKLNQENSNYKEANDNLHSNLVEMTEKFIQNEKEIEDTMKAIRKNKLLNKVYEFYRKKI